MAQMFTINDLCGRPLCYVLPVKTVHFDGLFRDEKQLTEVDLEFLSSVLRHRLVYLLTEYGDDLRVLAEELDAWRGLVPHAWAEENPRWALIFTTYADTVASAGAVAATKALDPAQKFFLTRCWNNIQRHKRVRRFAQLMGRNGFTLIGD
jgi:hypothetical protein